MSGGAVWGLVVFALSALDVVLAINLSQWPAVIVFAILTAVTAGGWCVL